MKNNSVKPSESTGGMLTAVKDAQPIEDEKKISEVKDEVSVIESGKSKKTPKKKKLSAKERKRLRLEQLELERQQQEAEEANRLAEARRMHEREMEKREEARLIEEDNQLRGIRAFRINQSKEERLFKTKDQEWSRYKSCDHTTNPQDQADVNSFISNWNDVVDNDMLKLFDHIEMACKLIEQLNEHIVSAEVENNANDYEKYSNLVMELRKLIQHKIETMTQHHLLFSDKYTGVKNEVLLTMENSGYSYGLWVNLAKNPRIKDIDFCNMSIEISKNVAMTSLAIRMTMSPFASEFGDYVLLSPVMSCEFFQLPSPPKKVNAFVLRQFSSLGSLVPIAYPLKNVSNAQPPLSFKMRIDPSRLPEDLSNVTIVKIDDLNHTDAMISNVNINVTESIVTFSSITTGLFALAVNRNIHFPFQFWEVNSKNPESVEIYLQTSLSNLTIMIDKNGLCSMDSPIKFCNYNASKAIEVLQRNGINLVSPKNLSILGDISARLSEKPKDLEEAFTNGVADTATGFRIRCSKWNSQISKGENEDKRIMLLAREIKEFGEPITDDEDVEEEDKKESIETIPEPSTRKRPSNWRCIQGTVKHINEVPNTEFADQFDLTMIPNTNFHQHLMPMLMDIASEDVKQRVLDTPSFMSETLRYLISKMRLFSNTL